MAGRRKKPRIWSYTGGAYGRSVRVYERKPGGIIYAATSDGEGGEIRESLGHRNREKAEEYADNEARKLRAGLASLGVARPTLRHVFRLYVEERTPTKAKRTQSEDRRQAVLFKRLWGADFDLRRLSRREWDRFIRERRSGAIDGRGKPVAAKKRRTVSDRTVERDLKFLRAVCRWATEWRDAQGNFLLESDPTRGLDVPTEKNPKRPVATHDRVDAIRAVYRRPRMEVMRRRKRVDVETYLPEIFEVVVGTGRRISAVCTLRYEDLELRRTSSAPHGAVVWPEDTDKQGRRWRCPISEPVREALEAAIRKRPRVGPGPLFPGPRKPTEPIGYELASKWLRQAEEEAGLEPQAGGLWHPYRRLWATARKDLPDVDVAQAGGWSSLEALKLAYQQPDDATMLRVVEHGAELREIK